MFNLKLSMREKKKKKNTTVVLFKAVVRKAASSSIRCTRTQSATTNEHALVHNQGEQTGGSEWRSLHLYIIVVKRVYVEANQILRLRVLVRLVLLRAGAPLPVTGQKDGP